MSHKGYWIYCIHCHKTGNEIRRENYRAGDRIPCTERNTRRGFHQYAYGGEGPDPKNVRMNIGIDVGHGKDKSVMVTTESVMVCVHCLRTASSIRRERKKTGWRVRCVARGTRYGKHEYTYRIKVNSINTY